MRFSKILCLILLSIVLISGCGSESSTTAPSETEGGEQEKEYISVSVYCSNVTIGGVYEEILGTDTINYYSINCTGQNKILNYHGEPAVFIENVEAPATIRVELDNYKLARATGMITYYLGGADYFDTYNISVEININGDTVVDRILRRDGKWYVTVNYP